MSVTSSFRTRVAPLYQRSREQLDDIVVRRARQLVRQCRSDPPAVLHLGASESVFVGPTDRDRRALSAMLAADLADVGSLQPLVVPGIQPELAEAYLRLIPAGVRPVVLMGLPVRLGLPQWRHHPVWSREGDSRRLGELQRAAPALTMRRLRRRPPPEAVRRYDASVLETFAGSRTCGEWRDLLRAGESSMSVEELTRARFAFFWGGIEDIDFEWVAGVERLFRYCAEERITVVPYHLFCSVKDGLGAWDGFEVFLDRNRVALEAAAARGMPETRFEDSTRFMDRSRFIDPTDATEHFNELGRRELSASLAARVRAAL